VVSPTAHAGLDVMALDGATPAQAWNTHRTMDCSGGRRKA
jgi:hypothetical protein